MQNFYEIAQHRRSCRVYDAKPVEREKLEQCMAAARLAPSACNSQPWRYQVVTKPEAVTEIAAAVQQFGINQFAAMVPAFITVCEVVPAKVMKMVRENYGTQAYAQMDIGLSVAHLTLQAADLGLGSCILGVFDEEKLRGLLDIPEDQKLRLVVAIGYPAAKDAFREKVREDLSEIVKFVE